jgi:hypothetical protein
MYAGVQLFRSFWFWKVASQMINFSVSASMMIRSSVG